MAGKPMFGRAMTDAERKRRSRAKKEGRDEMPFAAQRREVLERGILDQERMSEAIMWSARSEIYHVVEQSTELLQRLDDGYGRAHYRRIEQAVSDVRLADDYRAHGHILHLMMEFGREQQGHGRVTSGKGLLGDGLHRQDQIWHLVEESLPYFEPCRETGMLAGFSDARGGAPIYSRKNPGELAEPEEALCVLTVKGGPLYPALEARPFMHGYRRPKAERMHTPCDEVKIVELPDSGRKKPDASSASTSITSADQDGLGRRLYHGTATLDFGVYGLTREAAESRWRELCNVAVQAMASADHVPLEEWSTIDGGRHNPATLAPGGVQEITIAEIAAPDGEG